MEHKTMLLALALSAFVAVVSGDGYGQQVYSVPGGGKGKWKIKAKGKGMQNLIHHGGGGGGYEHKYDHKEEKHKTVYYPIPVHHHEYKKDDYHGYGSHNHEVSILPLYDQHGGGYHRRYGISPNEIGAYNSYSGSGPNYYGGPGYH